MGYMGILMDDGSCSHLLCLLWERNCVINVGLDPFDLEPLMFTSH